MAICAGQLEKEARLAQSMGMAEAESSVCVLSLHVIILGRSSWMLYYQYNSGRRYRVKVSCRGCVNPGRLAEVGIGRA